MTPITIWFDDIIQAQNWQTKLRGDNWVVSEIAARKSKRITLEVEFPLDNKDAFLYFNKELQNNIVCQS